MNYTKIQKIIASIIIPFFFFGLVFQFPITLFNYSSAWDRNIYSIVSILVDNEIYDDVEKSVKQYAEDIWKQLKNTKIIIIPTPKDSTAFQIASLNENLYYEGYKWVKDSIEFESKLIGTVIVGSIPTPVIYKNKELTKSILPYVDFIDKSFIYDHKTKKYKENKNSISGVKPEIWHWIISPNTWTKEWNIVAINDYFDKNHNFYQGTWKFKSKNIIINWKTEEKNPSSYKPYVFYFDQFREQQGLSYSKYLGYKTYMENKEDIVYKRYSKDLADKIKDAVLVDSNDKILSLIGQVDNTFDFSTTSNEPDISLSPDILLKHIIEKVGKKYIEVLNSSKIWEFRKDVNNAWRYSFSWNNVNLDTIPHLISILDEVWDNILKWVNKTIEEEINDIVINKWLSRKIAIPTNIEKENSHTFWLGSSISCPKHYENILFWKQARNITSAKECSIYLGSNNYHWQLVQANRWLNLNLVNSDMWICSKWKTKGYWWGNSPVNLDQEKAKKWILTLSSHDVNWAIEPLFDVVGSLKEKNNSKVPSPLDCLNNNFLLSYKEEMKNNYISDDYYCSNSYTLPINWKSKKWWGCDTNNIKYASNKNFKNLYSSIEDWKACGSIKYSLFINGDKIKENTQRYNTYDAETSTAICSIEKHYFKTIPSYIKHISPTFEELNIQLKSKITPNLWIDKNRYIDFISAKWNHSKIEYPYLFRLNKKISGVDNFESQLRIISIELDKILNKKSTEINDLIKNNNPSTLSGNDLAIYNTYLKIAKYPNPDIDLLQFIKNQPSKEIDLFGEKKEISYYDSLVFALLWNNLSSVGQKYQFVFTNYLSDQTESKNKFFLPKNKKIYEIAYLWAPWDSQNMYIKLDPEGKWENPFANLDSLNANLNANLLTFWLNSSWYSNEDWNSKCSPPGWVTIFEWPSAVACWLDELKVENFISASKCSPETLFLDDEKKKENDKNEKWEYVCKVDDNNNGVEDCIENELNKAKIELVSSADKVYINKSIWLEARVLSDSGKLFKDLNNLKTKFKLIKIEAKKDESKELNNNNIQVVFDINSLNELSQKNKKKYISFKDSSISVRKGVAKYNFNSKGKEANYYIIAEIDILDKDKKIVKTIKSETIKVKIRKEVFFSNKFLVVWDNAEIKSWNNWIIASEHKNIYLIDLNKTSYKEVTPIISPNSNSREKLVISLNHYTDKNKQIKLNYPLKVSIIKDWEKIVEDFNIIESNLKEFHPLVSLEKSWSYKIIITGKYWEKTTQTINVLPEIASKMDLNLGTTVLETNWDITSNIIILKDKYDNIANWTAYKIFLESNWHFGFPINESEILTKKEINVFEWYKWFRIKAHNSSWVWKIKIIVKKEDKEIINYEKNIQIINNIKISLEKTSEIKVWNKEYNLKAIFKDNTWNVLKNLNTKLYFVINKSYWKSVKNYVNVVKGEADIIFKTNILAGKEIPVELKIEGTREIKKDLITILPEIPIKLNLILSKNKLKASNDSKTLLRIELKDVFNNIVFNDNSTKVKFDISEKYKKVIDNNGNNIKTINNWIATFELNATSSPWTAYFKVSTIPNLSQNSFKLWDKTINWVGEKSGKIQTYFFWDKAVFSEKKYNALYTVLLWAAYWDITQKDYLASSLLFNKNNRSLAVTSLIANPWKFLNIVNVSGSWEVKNISSTWDLSQDIELIYGTDKNNKKYINIFNKALNINVWKITYKKDQIESIDDLDIKIFSGEYWIHNWMDWNVKIFYKDPFWNLSALNSFAKTNLYGLETFEKKGHLGWRENNKFLLSFASGRNIWDSVKDYQSIGLINLGDPVVSLKKNKNSDIRSFDSTIWKKITNDDNISKYNVFDYDNDWKEDILLVKNNGFLKLLENKLYWEWFLDKWNLAYIADSWLKTFVHTGDFTWDWYDDIFFVNNKWIPSILNNNFKDFKRFSLEKQFSALKWEIVQVESFDMDNDWKTDIITLDDNWDINIFYGWGTNFSPLFTKKFIWWGFGVSLSSETRKNWGFIYFDWLYQKSQIPEPIKKNSIINEDLINRQLYLQIPYWKWNSKNNSIPKRTFIKSDYSEISWISVTKTFTDKNWNTLKPWDIVNVEIIIKNISESTKSNIVFIDNISKPFSLTKDKINITKWKQKIAPAWYDILIDEITLSPNEKTVIKYNLITPNLTFWNIRVGLFENSGVYGEDKYWDIIIAKDNKNCSENIQIYNSDNLVVRKYSDLVNRAPICNENKLKLPDWIDPNIKEKFKDIDKMSIEQKTKIANENKNKIDWKEYLENIDPLKKLDQLNKWSDEQVEKIDEIIDWFNCGFWWWWCITTPLNWAPLAPWQDPTLFGYPIWDWLKVAEWIPVFSALTGLSWPFCAPVPAVWPISPFSFPWWVCGWTFWAGWYLGVNSPTNFVRIFWTPTLTWWQGTAVCFGWPASVIWSITPPPGLSPLMPWGNCIVTAKPLAMCSTDWSEWDPESIGQADYFWWNAWFGVINWNCGYSKKKTFGNMDKDFLKKYYNIKNNWWYFDEDFEKDYKKMIKKFSSTIWGSVSSWQFWQTPLFSIGWKEVEADKLKSSLNLPDGLEEPFEDILEIQQTKISGFPNFLMWWVDAQIEEIVNKLTTFPTLSIILPDFSGIFDTDWSEHFSKQWEILMEEKNISINSGIDSAYQFLWNLPLINIKPKRVNLDIPWIDENTLDKIILDFKLTKKQWENEFNVSKISGSAAVDVSKLISTLNQNIETLEEYKEFPRKLANLLNKKEVWIEQVMCNVENISEITSGWIWRNWKIFKTWVKTFILIKSILKSWQALIDIFIDFDAECKECKNERWDLMEFQFKLISMILPKFPIIKFPKWPDIILDLHNIRMGITVEMPDFNITKRIITLPTLPKLILPTANIDLKLKLPDMPLLPKYELPELPDLPSLPTITLPDLPPAPQLPEIFSELKWVLKILKLVTKAMCLLKSLPFVPEWRAWDHIAFLTERNGYMPTDFIDISMPQFDMPYIDAIKVSTFVNLETDTSFLVDMINTALEPINKWTNDFVNDFKTKWFDNLDFSEYSIDIKKELWILNSKKDNLVSSDEFLILVNKSLADKEFTSMNNKKIDEIKKVWEFASNYTYSKENLLIANLQKNNSEKFGLFRHILINEIKKNKELKKSLKDIWNTNLFTQISWELWNKDFVNYEKSLKKYNDKFLLAAKNLINWWVDNEIKEIRTKSKNILTKVRWWLNNYKTSNNNHLLSSTVWSEILSANGQNSCQQKNNSDFSYNYKWIYIVENDKSYRLFNYMDELTWDEKYSTIDSDNDWDLDLLYFVNGELYLKENLKTKNEKETSSKGIYVLDISKNKYFKWNFIEAINWFKEVNTDNLILNLSFQAPTDDNISHFRVEYYNIIDKAVNKNIEDWIWKNIIDAFVERNEKNYWIKPHRAYINFVWEIPAVNLNTVEMIDMTNSLSANNKINVSSSTKIYTWNKSSHIIYYIWNNSNSIIEKIIPENSSFNHKENIVIISVNGWKIYSKWAVNINLIWNEIKKYIGLPLFNKSSFTVIPDLKNKLIRSKSHIDIKYSWNKLKKSINFKDVSSYIYYDLWNKSSDYLIRVDSYNDFFYWKIYAIKWKTIWTHSRQVLFSPQIESDILPPELNVSEIIWASNGVIRIPVYHSKTIDLSSSIYENSWLENIKSIKVDLEWHNSKINIIKTNNNIKIHFAKFEKLFKKKISIILEDNNWNKSNHKLGFEVYSPIPKITNHSKNIIKWVVSEQLSSKPINIYRVRAGQLKRLETKDAKIKVNSIDEWIFVFNYNYNENSGWLVLKDSIWDVSFVNENTWKIKINKSNYKVVIEKNNLLFPKFIIKKLDNTEIYSQYIRLNQNQNIWLMDNFEIFEEGIGLYLKKVESVGYYKIPQWAKYSAWTVVIHKKWDPLEKYFTIFPDGRIDYNNDNFIIEYSYKKENILLILKNKNNKKVGELLYNINWSYLMK